MNVSHRQGGEEFACILPNTSTDEALPIVKLLENL